MLADYHVHSEFSDDSKTPMEMQIERAIELKLDEICFTDHVDYGIKDDWSVNKIRRLDFQGETNNIDNCDILCNVHYPEYFLKLYRMKKTYDGRIKVKNGLEFGIQHHTINSYLDILNKYGDQLDFVLLSIHQVNNKEFWTQEFQTGKTQDEYNNAYYDEMLKVVKDFNGYDILSHVDLISRYDKQGIYPFEKIKDKLTKIFKIVIANSKGIEINTSSWHYSLQDTTPSRNILMLYYDLGGRIITIGSDAHKPEFIGDHFNDAVRILKDIGFEQYYTFDHHVPIAHDL